MNDIEAKVIVEKIIYYDSQGESHFGILAVSVHEIISGEPVYNNFGNITIKGHFVEPCIGEEYHIVAHYIEDKKYGGQYEVSYIQSEVNFSSKFDRDRFVHMIFQDTPETLHNLYEAFDDPFVPLESKDVGALLQVKGIGKIRVRQILNKFHKKYAFAPVYLQLAEYNLTDSMCAKVCEAFGSADLVVQALKDNPYCLIYLVDGIGWKKADAIALRGGEAPFSLHRIEAFIYYYLKLQGEEGDSWVYPDELMAAAIENLGDDIQPFNIAEAIHDLGDKLWYDEDHTRIGLMRYFTAEDKLAKELIRIRDCNNTFEYENWEEKIDSQELEQGWEFTDEQRAGIKACLENQVVLITGKGGTGKSSTVKGMLAVLGKYDYALCALSGKASARLAELTGKEGHTIHRLLGYGNEGYTFDDKNPLAEDIIIVDEVSMINIDLMYHLCRAIKNGAKLIMLGDVAQLPPIGTGNFANDVLASPEIAKITLAKIHRQAAKSAIITQSIAISNGDMIVAKDWEGVECRGELQDLLIDCYYSANLTFYRIMEHYSDMISKGISANDIQVVVPMKTRGESSVYLINIAIQNICNPHKKGNDEVVVAFEKDRSYTFRTGDRVINRKNNYHAKEWLKDGEEGKEIPIFNGNIGVIRQVDSYANSIIVDFEGIGTVYLQGSDIRDIQLAYAITCHSSQGSEFEHVIVGIDYSAYSLLSRQWLYTAITRAKKTCVLCAQTSALRFATMQNNVINKHTHLQECLSLNAPKDEVKQEDIIW